MSERKRAPRPPYPPEVRERAVGWCSIIRMSTRRRWKAIESISATLSINHETLRQYMPKAALNREEMGTDLSQRSPVGL
jgi:hypothetical protein